MSTILPQLTNEINVNKPVLLTMLLAGISATADKALKGALTRARGAVLAGRALRFDGTTLEVQSMSRSWQFHSCTLTACDCEAGQHNRICWHRALFGVLLAMQTLTAAMTVVATPPAPAATVDSDGYLRDADGDIVGYAVGTKTTYTVTEYTALFV